MPGVIASQIGTASGVKWENVANLLWLGSDLDWTIQAIRNAAPKETIVHGLTQASYHISELGLADTTPGKLLSSLRSQAQSTPEGGLNQQWRKDFAEKVSQVLHGVSGLARTQQPTFRPDPV